MQLNETPAWRRRLVRVVSMEAKGTSKEMELCSILTRQNLDKAAKPTGVCLPFSVVFEVEQWQVENGVIIMGLNYKQKYFQVSTVEGLETCERNFVNLIHLVTGLFLHNSLRVKSE